MKATIISAILLVVVAGGVSRTEAVQATPPLALDGIGTATKSWCVHTVPNFSWCDEVAQSQLLTTTKGYDVIILIVQCGDGDGPCGNLPTIIDSTGLAFTERLSFASETYPGAKLWEYYSVATSPLRSDNVTVLYSCGSGNAIPVCGSSLPIQLLAIHGANTRAIFDPNPSIPATVSCPGPVCGGCYGVGNPIPCSVSIETSTFDFVIATTAINDAGSCGVYTDKPPSGFTNIATDDQFFEVDYSLTTTARTNVTFNCSGTDTIAIVVDAVSFYGAFGR